MTKKEVQDKIEAGTVSLKDVYAYAEHENISVNECFDRLAVTYAKEFMNNSMSFEDADDAVNSIWWMMCRYEPLDQKDFAILAYSIYGAFDAGEFTHSDGKDPVKTYTIPELLSILERLEKSTDKD